MNEKISIYLKGILMGICDLIPGISGGTIAFITGIYERLINAIAYISPKNKIEFLSALIKYDKKKIQKKIKESDIIFLLFLFAGIFTSIILGSHIISYLLENYIAYVLSFFLGLILASTKVIYDNVEKHGIKNQLFLLLGLILGAIIYFIPKQSIEPSNLYIIISGFIAISALFLPGISGSFLLLIMGVYEHIVNAVKSFEIKTITLFGIGAIAGVYFISRAIKFLFKTDKNKTLYTLIGLVIGTLIIPIQTIKENIAQINITTSLFLIFLTMLGIIIVILIDLFSKK